MRDFLARVVAERRADVAAARSAVPDEGVARAADRGAAPRSLERALRDRRGKGRLALIAEVKRTSPALGPLARIADPAALARSYTAAGACAISVLTEPRHWGGSFEDLSAIRKAVDVPVLCKDVVVDRYQLLQARAAGADAVLLIAEALDGPTLRALVRETRALGMEALVEAHERAAFEGAVSCGAVLVGVNARDLRTPELIEPDRIGELATLVREEQLLVAESGIASAADAAALPSRVDAILVGTALVRAADPAPLLRELASVARTSREAVPAGTEDGGA